LPAARAADDLKKLTGVSGAIEKKFNDPAFSITGSRELDHDTAHKIGERFGLPSRADAGWPAKAMTAEAVNNVSALAGTFRPPFSNLGNSWWRHGGEAAKPRPDRPDRQRTCNDGNDHCGDGQGRCARPPVSA